MTSLEVTLLVITLLAIALLGEGASEPLQIRL